MGRGKQKVSRQGQTIQEEMLHMYQRIVSLKKFESINKKILKDSTMIFSMSDEKLRRKKLIIKKKRNPRIQHFQTRQLWDRLASIRKLFKQAFSFPIQPFKNQFDLIYRYFYFIK